MNYLYDPDIINIMENLYEKQNDKDILNYLWASEYCETKKKALIYFGIVVSILLPVVSIINEFLPVLLPKVENIENISVTISQIIVLISGIVIILETVLGFTEDRFDVESVNLIEKYDIFVFNLFPNKSIMRPITDQTMLIYSSRYKKKASLLNYYFKTKKESENKYAHFNVLKKIFEYDYFLMLYAKNFLMTIWIGYIIVLLSIAFAINTTWTESIIYIFIPSLSSIGLIAESFHFYFLKIKFLENILSIIKDYSNQKEDTLNQERPNSKIVMRSLQDALFVHRRDDFIIPGFIKKSYDKKRLYEIENAPEGKIITKNR